jgi:hypothetical protein
MMLKAAALGAAYLGAVLAALVSEGDPLPWRACDGADVSVRLAALLLQPLRPPGALLFWLP